MLLVTLSIPESAVLSGVPATANPDPALLKGLIPRPIHVFPFVDVAIVFPPSPTATNNDPFHETPRPTVLKIVVPRPVHVVPFVDVAIVFPPP